MKRLHIHITVDDLSKSIGFYSTLFGHAPTKQRDDYAKWQLDDPLVNFAISDGSNKKGINHLGIQVDSADELAQIASRLEEAQIKHSTQEGASCCYANSNKHWAMDPQGIAWESFHTLSDAAVYGDDHNPEAKDNSSCCIPLSMDESKQEDSTCCVPNEKDVSACCN